MPGPVDVDGPGDPGIDVGHVHLAVSDTGRARAFYVDCLGLLATAAYQVVSGNTAGALVASEGFVVSLVPVAVERLSKTHVPRPLEFAFVLGMALQFISESRVR